MDMSETVKVFVEFYAEMYERSDKHPVGYYEAMGFGEFVMKNAGQFTREFCVERGDLLTSDREVAAFGYTVMKVNGLIDGLVWQ